MYFRFSSAPLNAEWKAIEQQMADYKFLVNVGKDTQANFIKKFSPLFDKYKMLKREESQANDSHLNKNGVYLNKNVSLASHIVIKGVR